MKAFFVFEKIRYNELGECLLSFSPSNNKLPYPYFSLPAGHTCPYAKQCKSKAIEVSPNKWNIKDYGDFRCYAAQAEVAFPNARRNRQDNYTLLKEAVTKENIVNLIERSFNYFFPKGLKILRLHESGDFYNQDYFDAWLEVIQNHPETIFYTYTKSLIYWINRINEIPENFKLNASKGGRLDYLIDEYELKYAEIVKTPEEAEEKGLEIDVDDKLAWSQDESFAILIHGIQPKTSVWGKNIRANKKWVKAKKGLIKESLSDYVKPKSEEEIRKNSDSLTLEEKLLTGCTDGIMFLVKDALNSNIDLTAPGTLSIYNKKNKKWEPLNIAELAVHAAYLNNYYDILEFLLDHPKIRKHISNKRYKRMKFLIKYK